jgi:hypothetical protein
MIPLQNTPINMNTIRNISLVGRIRHEAELIEKMIDRLSQQGGKLHRLDHDTLLAIARRMYEDMLLLDSSANEMEQDAAETKEEIKDFKEEVKQTKAVFVAQETPSVEKSIDFFAISTASNDQPLEEIAVDISPKTTPITTDEIPQKPPQPIPAKPEKAAVSFVPDLFGESQSSMIADKLAAKPDNSLAARIGKTRVDDLRQAIGINDKFLFINELFEGNIAQYNNAIDELNSFFSLNGALTYVKELSVLFAWPQESPAKDKLCQLLERKFDA